MRPQDQDSVEAIRRRARRMAHHREHPGASPLLGLGAFGVVGWSVALPAVLGALAGLWLDRVAPQDFSWPLALMLGGMVLGGVVAWDWVAREERRLRRQQPDPPRSSEQGDE